MTNYSYVVHYPSELEFQPYTGKIYGYFHESTGHYNITSWGKPTDNHMSAISLLGEIIIDSAPRAAQSDNSLLGTRSDSGLVFFRDGAVCQNQPYDLVSNIFSRNGGILETDLMLNKRALICGCGSVGSLAALELARAGCGNFLLVDNDIFGYHNICRHQGGVSDVGKYKTDVVKQRVIDVNPAAQVTAINNNVESLNKDVFDSFCNKDTILVGCGDNRQSDIYLNKIACTYNVPFVSIGLWERAFAGEVFYYRPSKNKPCSHCMFGSVDRGSLSTRNSESRRIYTNEESLANVRFEPGISADISFVVLVGVKLILDLLNADNPSFIPRLLGTLSEYTLICNTHDSRIAGEQAEIFSYPLQVTTSIKALFGPDCPPCKFE